MTAATPLTAPRGQEKNLLEMLLARATDTSTTAAKHKQGGVWREVGWKELAERVKALSNGLVGQGVKPGDRVAIFAATSLDFAVADLAISAARAVSVPIYASNTPDEVRYVLQNSGAVLLFVDDDAGDARQAGRLTRVREKLAECPECRHVVVLQAEAKGDRELPVAALLEKGAGVTDFDARVAAIGPDDLCHFIYTSGTTGDPKGVMLTHGNWMYEARSLKAMNVMAPGDALMLFLPLAHSFAQGAKAAWLGGGLTMIFAESIEKLVTNLAETQPSILPTVPRVLEKVFAGVQGTALSAPGVKGALARWAFRLFDEHVEAREAGRAYESLGWALAKRLVFKKVRATLDQKLGGKMRLFISGGAPLPRKIGYFFELLGYLVAEGYGLTETSAGASIGRPDKLRVGTVGIPFPDCEFKLASDGEILIRGANVMKGYYKNEAATAEVLEKDGWFHSGDIGEIDKDGFVRITDRKKDLIKTSGGKYCAPQNLENSLKTFPIVSLAMVHGDLRPFLTVLICVSEENGKKLLAEKGVTVGSYAELVKRPEIVEAVKKAVDQVNAQLPPYSTMKKHALMDHDFTQETGELTPTLKVKRKVCTQRYKDVLDAMYA